MTLALLAPPPPAQRVLAGDWRLAQTSEPAGLAAGYTDPTFDDTAWEVARLPHLGRATAENDTLWYRHHFTLEAPPAGERTVLRLGGAFYHTRAWLNGAELGSHTGYFQPFGFDLTNRFQPGDNLLVVCCRFPVEAGAFKRKTAVAGIFADWDCKPYPSTLYPNLPAPFEWTVPVGLWQPVSLCASGPLLIEAFNVFATPRNPQWPARAERADLRLVVRLNNLTAVTQTAHLTIAVEPASSADGAGAQGRWEVTLDAGQQRQVEYQLTLPGPRLWLPWTHGEPFLYRATLRLEAGAGQPLSQVVQTFGVREVRAEIAPGRWDWWLNGRRIFPKGSNYVSDFYLDRVTPDGLRRDLALARGANLDLLRVHAHLAPPDFYRLCDEQGLLVLCDFPLIWTYAYGLPPEEEAAFDATVIAQAEAMVHLLGSHPSIIEWSLHNEPPWTPDGAFLGQELQQAGANRAIDQAAAERVRALDSSRPAIAASGEFDQHLYHGWYTGGLLDNRDLHPPFPTEFGVQALPNRDSPVWATVNTHWPVEAEDPTWAHAGYQSIFWASPGVGAPAQYASLADYVDESQRYQAAYIRYTIDQWRRQKFNPVGGYAHFLLTDGWPALTWSVLDYYRLPKRGYQALAEASRPVRLCLDLDPLGGLSVTRSYHFAWPEAGQISLGLYLVNDDYREAGEVSVRWWLERRRSAGLLSWLRGLGRRLPAGQMAAALPRADEAARLVRALTLPAPPAGVYRFHTLVRQGRRVLDENGFAFRVGEAPVHARPVRHVPRLLVNRVYQTGSLRRTADGFTFELRNPTLTVALQRLIAMRVDGQPLEPAQVELICAGLTRPMAAITPQAPFEFPSGARLTVVVHDRPLPPGVHEIELTIQLLAFGEISARLKDHLI